jgi:hypothetical protein
MASCGDSVVVVPDVLPEVDDVLLLVVVAAPAAATRQESRMKVNIQSLWFIISPFF